MNNTYRVTECRLPAIVQTLDRLVKRANKLGVDSIDYTVSEPEYQTIWVNYGLRKVRTEKPTGLCADGYVERVVTYHTVTFTGQPPKIAGWSLLAVAETLEGGTLFRKAPGTEVEVEHRYHNAGSTCEHCNHKRDRKDVFILLSEDGIQKQVGRQCLRDFLGHHSPEAMLNIANYYSSIEAMFSERGDASSPEDFDFWDEGGYTPRAYPVSQILVYTAAFLRECNGAFITGKYARENGTESTSDLVARALTSRNHKDEPTVIDADRALTDTVIETMKADFAAKGSNMSDFERNMSVILNSTYIAMKNVGIACYIVEAYRRMVSAKIEAASKPAKNAVHTGNVGDRLKDLNLTVTRVNGFESDWGYVAFISMVDADGVVYVWKTGTADFNPGDKVTLTGTVKEHSEFRGEAQTILTRCKVSSVVEATPAQ